MRHRIWTTGLLAAPLLVAACSDAIDPVDSEELAVDLDVAQYVADATSDDLVMIYQGLDQLGAAPATAPPHFGDDVVFSRSVTFFDVDGAEMDAFDPLLTASVHLVASLEGQRSRESDRGTLTVSISRSRDFWFTGLEGDETARTINGEGAASKNRTVSVTDRGERSYDFSSTTLVENVIVPVPRGSGWPLSGTITKSVIVEVVAGLDDPRTRERTVVIEFNGTQFATITINGVRTCILDLDLREVSCESDG